MAATDTALRFAPKFRVLQRSVARAGFEMNSAVRRPLPAGQLVRYPPVDRDSYFQTLGHHPTAEAPVMIGTSCIRLEQS